MKFKIGDIVKRKRNEDLKFKITSMYYEDSENLVIKILSIPDEEISEECYPEQLEKI